MIQGGNEHNESILFRGQANEAFELIPSIARPVLTGNLISEERNLIELAMLKLPDVFKADMRPLERLALLQHYGIPTRLLDVTENALVALYFACCSNNANNGEIIIFKSNDSKVTPLPISEAICDSYRFATSGTFLTDFYDNIINQPYYLEHQLLHKSYITDSSQKTLWVEQYCDKPHFTHAPIRSLRQQVQRLRAEYASINIVIALILNMLWVYFVVSMTGRVERFLGKGGIYIIRKFFGIILLAISVRLFTANITLLIAALQK